MLDTGKTMNLIKTPIDVFLTQYLELVTSDVLNVQYDKAMELLNKNGWTEEEFLFELNNIRSKNEFS